ncbi:MAG: hypothetical protein MJK10_01345 [Pseudomonadales bacterium]|nr:hypothetical protein [Pseudomonadales bacterium]NRA14521.1 hypothetical protein [Oceanospirillaceae bacterium]
MILSKLIELDFTKQNFVVLLKSGADRYQSLYSHKQIAEWCEKFWYQYSDVDAPEGIENLLCLLADVETQWDLFLVNTYSTDELQKMDLDKVKLPYSWFDGWLSEVEA